MSMKFPGFSSKLNASGNNMPNKAVATGSQEKGCFSFLRQCLRPNRRSRVDGQTRAMSTPGTNRLGLAKGRPQEDPCPQRRRITGGNGPDMRSGSSSDPDTVRITAPELQGVTTEMPTIRHPGLTPLSKEPLNQERLDEKMELLEKVRKQMDSLEPDPTTEKFQGDWVRFVVEVKTYSLSVNTRFHEVADELLQRAEGILGRGTLDALSSTDGNNTSLMPPATDDDDYSTIVERYTPTPSENQQTQPKGILKARGGQETKEDGIASSKAEKKSVAFSATKTVTFSMEGNAYVSVSEVEPDQITIEAGKTTGPVRPKKDNTIEGKLLRLTQAAKLTPRLSSKSSEFTVKVVDLGNAHQFDLESKKSIDLKADKLLREASQMLNTDV